MTTRQFKLIIALLVALLEDNETKPPVRSCPHPTPFRSRGGNRITKGV